MNTPRGYQAYQINKSAHIGPDNPLFHSFDLNLVILTKYGRFVFLRHGNEDRCSSFFATIATIVNKLEMSFAKEDHPANLKRIKQGILEFYVLKRANFMYIFWSKGSYSQLRLYSMVELLHYQLMSSLTSKISQIIQSNQNYDPTINFGKGNAVPNLLQYALRNGLSSLPALFNAMPIINLSSQVRSQISSLLRISEIKQQGLYMSILMTMNSVIGISRKKSIDVVTKDIFLFFILVQAQSTLSKSENWFPICIPGLSEDGMLFCYLNFIDAEIFHVLIVDDFQLFPKAKQVNKQLREKLQTSGLLAKIISANAKDLIEDPSIDRPLLLKHFVIRNQTNDQMVMSQGQYFGDNSQTLPEYSHYHNLYSQLYQHLLTLKHYRKQKLHVQTLKNNIGGYYEEGGLAIFFILSRLADLEQAKNVINGIIKLVKEEQSSLFIKY